MRKWPLIPIGLIFIFGFTPFLCSHGLFKTMILDIAGRKIGMRLEAKKANFSWLGPQKLFQVELKSPDIDGSIETLFGHVPFWKLSSIQTELELAGGRFQIHPEGSPPIAVEQVEGSISGAAINLYGTTREQGQTGEFSLQGQAPNPTLDKTEIDLKISATRMPSLLIDRLAKLNGMFAGAVGPTFDCTAKAEIHEKTGSLELHLQSESAQAALFAHFDAKGIYLSKPLAISFRLTPILSETLLKKVNPLFLTGLQSKTPILLQISEKNFLIPRPFSLRKLLIGQGTLDMGQIRIQNGPSLASLLSLLQNAHLKNLRQMNAWFTPLQFSIQEGSLHTGRMDFLLDDSIHLCTWGDIDLIDDKLNMMLGLPADTLAAAFGLKNLPSNYVMKIPIRGKTSSPDIETGPASAKIAAAIATQTLPIKKGAFGGLLKLFNPAAFDDASDVPPAKRPFPWEYSGST